MKFKITDIISFVTEESPLSLSLGYFLENAQKNLQMLYLAIQNLNL